MGCRSVDSPCLLFEGHQLLSVKSHQPLLSGSLDYIKRLRYCEYLGRYFCQCCHENAQMAVPSRILRKWDFSKYYVSNFSKDLLLKIWNDPLFNVQDINSALYRKVKLLNQVRVR